MNCEDLKDVYELYALGVVEGEEREEVAAHLARGCDACRSGVSRAIALNSMLLGSVEDVKAPRRLKRRILASVGGKHRSWTWAGILAAACMLAIAVFFGAQERERARELAEARQQLLALSADRDRMAECLRMLDQPDTMLVGFGKGQPAPPHGNVFVNGRSGVLLIASNLPRLAQGRLFEMWLIPKGGSPHPAGMFQPGASGVGFNLLSGPVDVSTLGAVAVTVEPEAGSPAPTSTPILAVPVTSGP
jgi:hypothetical protein